MYVGKLVEVSRQSVGTSYREILLPRGNAGKVVSTGKTDRQGETGRARQGMKKAEKRRRGTVN